LEPDVVRRLLYTEIVVVVDLDQETFSSGDFRKPAPEARSASAWFSACRK
jgi:hypothetical protein